MKGKRTGISPIALAAGIVVLMIVSGGVGFYAGLSSSTSSAPISTLTTTVSSTLTTTITASAFQSTGGVNETSLYQAALKEGSTVTVYSDLVSAASDNLVKAFATKYPGITVQKYLSDSASVANKWLSESSAGQNIIDVCECGFQIVNIKSQGLVAPYTPSYVKQAGPQNYYPTGAYDPDGYFWGDASFATGVAINTNLVPPNSITSILNLTNPIWKGKIGWTNPTTGGGPSEFIFYLRNVYLNDSHRFSPGLGFDNSTLQFFKALNQQGITFFASQAQTHAALAGGQIAIMLAALPDTVEQLKAQGSPVDWLRLKPATPAPPVFIAIAAKAPHPNAARLYEDFVVSPDGQAALSQAMLPATTAALAAQTRLNGHGVPFVAGITLAEKTWNANNFANVTRFDKQSFPSLA